MKAAVEAYFGIDLSQDRRRPRPRSSPGCPKSPSNYDLVRNAIEQCTTAVAEGDRLPEVDAARRPPDDDHRPAPEPDPRPARRRRPDADVGRPVHAADFTAAKNEDVVARQPGHAALDRAAFRLGRPRRARPTSCAAPTPDLHGPRERRAAGHDDARREAPEDRREVGPGGGHRAARQEPRRGRQGARLQDASSHGWRTCATKDLHNGALVALDYQTGELVAYVGSANYYASSTKPEFQPQFDVVGKGFRQPGSAFKPFNYVDRHRRPRRSPPARCSWTSATDFGGGYTPNDADNLERGPVRVRNALQFSLNIPSVKAMAGQRRPTTSSPRPRTSG